MSARVLLTSLASLAVCSGFGFEGIPIKSTCQEYFDDGKRESGVYELDSGDTVYCDLSGVQGVAWTLLMNVGATDTFEYFNSAWTQASGSYPQPSVVPVMDEKYAPFDTMPLKQLRLDNLDLSLTTVLDFLEQDKDMTLLSLMQRTTATRLLHVTGPAHPFELVHGNTIATCGWPYSINGQGTDSFRQRIGGTFTHTWDCNYQADPNGYQTGAESAGFGLFDNQWGGFIHAKKGFGIRQAHDYDTAPGGGQTKRRGAIWGR